MEDERIAKIIDFLEHFRERPTLYAGDRTEEAVGTFLGGFDIACHLVGLSLPNEMRGQAKAGRGWPRSAEAWSISEMRKRGFSEEDIVCEIIEIEIDAWRRLVAQSGA